MVLIQSKPINKTINKLFMVYLVLGSNLLGHVDNTNQVDLQRSTAVALSIYYFVVLPCML